MIYVKMVIPEIKRKCMAKVCVANTYVSISSQSMAKSTQMDNTLYVTFWLRNASHLSSHLVLTSQGQETKV